MHVELVSFFIFFLLETEGLAVDFAVGCFFLYTRMTFLFPAYATKCVCVFILNASIFLFLFQFLSLSFLFSFVMFRSFSQRTRK